MVSEYHSDPLLRLRVDYIHAVPRKTRERVVSWVGVWWPDDGRRKRPKLLWMAPRQVVVLPISEKHHAYALSVVERLQQAGVRVEADLRNEKVGYKIREAQMNKIPYMFVLGDKEVEANTVNVRRYSSKDSETVPFGQFLEDIKKDARV